MRSCPQTCVHSPYLFSPHRESSWQKTMVGRGEWREGRGEWREWREERGGEGAQAVVRQGPGVRTLLTQSVDLCFFLLPQISLESHFWVFGKAWRDTCVGHQHGQAVTLMGAKGSRTGHQVSPVYLYVLTVGLSSASLCRSLEIHK